VLRGAFIGFGNVAANAHLPVWQMRDDVRIVAATDMLSIRRDAFLEACPKARWHENLNDLLSGKALDFVDICTPPSSHAALITRALAAGLHVLCEKPLVTTPGDARLVSAAAKSAARVVHTVHNWLKAPVCRKISALIDAGAIGPVRSILWRTVRMQPAVSIAPEGGTNWRLDPAIAGGGILLDHGWHALYCTLHWGGAASSVAAVLESRRFRESMLEDTANLQLELISGTAEIYLTWAGEERCNSIEIDGEQGHIHVANDRVAFKSRSGEQHWVYPPSLSEGSYHRDWFSGITDDFCAAVARGRRSNLDDAIQCARPIHLAQRSSAAGGLRMTIEGNLAGD